MNRSLNAVRTRLSRIANSPPFLIDAASEFIRLSNISINDLNGLVDKSPINILCRPGDENGQ